MSVSPVPAVKSEQLHADQSSTKARFFALTIGSVGVVYGDIGTSPLYAFREALVAATGSGSVTKDVVLGVLSLIFWSLILVVTLKYVSFCYGRTTTAKVARSRSQRWAFARLAGAPGQS